MGCIFVHQTPIPDSYWVIPGKFLAGEYPGALDLDTAQMRLRRFVAAGVTFSSI